MVKLVVYGEPVPKGRPRFTMRGGFAKAYTPAKTAEYEARIRNAYKKEYPDFSFGEKPLSVKILAFIGIPKSFTKKRRALIEQGADLPCGKIDCDNIAKSCLDSLNGVAYKDDKQVIRLFVRKFYSYVPRTEIIITEDLEDRCAEEEMFM